jgi:hypothetical protein
MEQLRTKIQRVILWKQREGVRRTIYEKRRLLLSGMGMYDLGGISGFYYCSYLNPCAPMRCRADASQGETLRKMEAALLKLEKGAYGICKDWDEEICEGTLRVLPYVLYCLGCQELREQEKGGRQV